MSTATVPARRGTSNGNARGGTRDRARRRRWLIETYRADVDVHPHRSVADVDFAVPLGEGVPATRCYRCGCLLTEQTLTIDRIIPGHKGGTYRRNNIRPACGPCNFGSTRKRGPWREDPDEPPAAEDPEGEYVPPWETAWGA